MIIPSQARDLFEGIRGAADSVQVLRAMVNSSPPTTESNWLDFKGALERTGHQPPIELPDEKVKEIWSKALSGFANTQGGVLIWGIDARKDDVSGVDQAVGFALVPNPHRFASRLKEIQRQATDPPILNVEVECWADPLEKGAGFVVCFVPESAYRPHKAMYHKRHGFFVRTTNDFDEAGVSLLRALFYQQARPHLHLVAKCRYRPKEHPKAVLAFELSNGGTATAMDLFVRFTYNGPEPDGRAPNNFCWKYDRAPDWFSLSALKPLHPGVSVPLISLNFDRPDLPRLDLNIEVTVFGMNMPATVFSLILTDDEAVHELERRPEPRLVIS